MAAPNDGDVCRSAGLSFCLSAFISATVGQTVLEFGTDIRSASRTVWDDSDGPDLSSVVIRRKFLLVRIKLMIQSARYHITKLTFVLLKG